MAKKIMGRLALAFALGSALFVAAGCGAYHHHYDYHHYDRHYGGYSYR